MKATKYFFERGELLVEWNSTAISLVPNNEAPASINNYRPIACALEVSYQNPR